MECVVIILVLLRIISAEVQPQVFYSIEEEIPIGTIIGNFAQDSKLHEEYPDFYDQLEYSILSQAPSGLFGLEDNRPVLKSLDRLDRDAVCPKQEQCTAEVNIKVGPSEYFHIIQVEVEIVDLNDNVPEFPESRIEISLPESSHIGSRIALSTAYDPDSPANAIRRYSLEDTTSTFGIDVINNTDVGFELYIAVRKELDRESKDKFSMNLLAYDGYGPTAHSGSTTVEVTIQDINDNVPVFQLSAYEFAVEEPVSEDSLIGTVKAVDLDIGDNAVVVYSIAPSISIPFIIDSASGEIYNSIVLDHEEHSSYVFTVKATNELGLSLPGSARITVKILDINDNPPVISIQGDSREDIAIEISEDVNPGAFVSHFTVTDHDDKQNGEFVCTLNFPQFQLIKLFDSQYKITTMTSLDREAIPYYDLKITCEDNGEPKLSAKKTLPVLINDVNDNTPQFSQLVYLASVIENAAPGTSVFTASATDPDAGSNGQVVYSLDNASNFTIDSRTGLIRSKISFDREEVNRVQLLVYANDLGVDLQMTSTATIILDVVDLNDDIPSFLEPEYTFAVYENQAPGTEVGQVHAIDRDDEPFNDFVYSMLFPEDASIPLPFEMDPYSGKIWTTTGLDREGRAEYTLTAYATSIGRHPTYGTAQINIYIADKNDQPPVLNFPSEYNNTVHIASLPAEQLVARINATDHDVGTNALLSYFISGEDSFMFHVDESSGDIITRVDLNKYDQHAFVLTVVARDHGDPPLTAQGSISIIVNSSIPFDPLPLSSRLNRTILVIVVGISAVAMVMLLLGIAAVWFVHRRAAKNHKMAVLRKQLITLSNSDHRDSISVESDFHINKNAFDASGQSGSEPNNLGKFIIRKKSSVREPPLRSHSSKSEHRPPPKPPRVPDNDENIKHKPPVAPNRKLSSKGSEVRPDVLDCCSSGGNSENSDVTDSGRGSCDDGTTQSRHPLLQTPQKNVQLRRISSDAPAIPPKRYYGDQPGNHGNLLPRTPQRPFNIHDIPDPIYPTPGGTPSPDPNLLQRLQATPKDKYRMDSDLTEHGSYV